MLKSTWRSLEKKNTLRLPPYINGILYVQFKNIPMWIFQNRPIVLAVDNILQTMLQE